MYAFFFFLYLIWSSPILLTIVCVAIGGFIVLLIAQKMERIAERKKITADNQAAVQKLQTDREAHDLLVKERYEPEIAAKILSHQLWQGMTAEQLMDSAGTPEAVDKYVTKRTRKEIWKYDQQTATRFGTRVTLEDGIVTGWFQR